MNNNQYIYNFSEFNANIQNLNKNFFNIMSVNIRSISSVTKFNRFKALIAKLFTLPAIIAVQETWFNTNVCKIYNIPGYKSIHCCRSDGYGGTSLFVRDQLHFTVEESKSEGFIEYIILKIQNVKVDWKPLTMISVYKSPKCSPSNFLNFLETIIARHGRNPCIFVGDANIDAIDINAFTDVSNILQNCDFCNCHELITRPKSHSCLDHVYSNLSKQMFIYSVECNLTDHNLIYCSIDLNVPLHDVVQHEYTVCDYEKLKTNVRTQFQTFMIFGNPTEDAQNFIKCIQKAVDNSTVTKFCNSNIKSKIAPWINGNLHKLIAYKERLLKMRRKCPGNEIVKLQLKRISNIIKKSHKNSMNNYYANNLSNFQSDPRKTWNFLNETLGRVVERNVSLQDNNGSIIVNNKCKAEEFNKKFLYAIQEIKDKIESLQHDNCNFFRTLRYCRNVFTLNCTSYNEIQREVSNLTVGKSCDHDNISSKVIKLSSNYVIPYMVTIFNNMISTSTYPNVLKIHKIIPISKEKNATIIDQYRPISVLPVINNIFERIIHRQICNFFDENDILNNCQYGFRKGCGTEEAVINVQNFICRTLDEGFNGVAGIFFDLSKAFDMIDHKILIQKLSFYGIHGNELALFKSYLQNRHQFVQIMNQKSKMAVIEHGVPQGSVLGPLLFLTYINDLFNMNFNGRLFMYADDLCLFYPYKSETVVKCYMERDSALIFEYMRINKLFINRKKTKVIRFKPHSRFNSDFHITVDGEIIHEVNTVKYLGLILQSNLAWSQHINHLKSKISPAIGLMYKFKNKFDERTKFLIYQTLIQSHLNYLAIIYAHKKSSELKSLQRLQNKALKTVANLPITNSTYSLYNDAFPTILPIHGIYKLQLLLYVYKSLHHIGHHTIQFNLNHNNTRNNQQLRVALCRTETTKQRVEYSGSREFNMLPQHIKQSNRLSSFKNILKQYMSTQIEIFL